MTLAWRKFLLEKNFFCKNSGIHGPFGLLVLLAPSSVHLFDFLKYLFQGLILYKTLLLNLWALAIFPTSKDYVKNHY